MLKLKGIWQADKYNRLNFELSRKEHNDNLAFKGIWIINRHHQIVYHYEKLETKVKKELILSGLWDIFTHNLIGYRLSGSNQSRFEFRAYIQTPSLYPGSKTIKYRVGIGTRGNRRQRTLIFYGKWAFSRKAGVSFEIDCGKGKIKKIKFSAKVNLSGKDTLVFSLIDYAGHPMGIKLTLSRGFLKQANFKYFLRLAYQKKEISLKSGIYFYF